MITDPDIKALSGPDAKARANGDPDGGLTGTVSDVTIADPVTDKTPKAKGLTVGDIANQVGQNKIAINFVWTLVTGFLVMFMQAGFAIVETGLCRVKNANHTMMMNFMVYGVGMLAYWLIGFAHTRGRRRRGGQPGQLAGAQPTSSSITLFGKPFGLWGQGGFFLMHNGAYDVFAMVLFLFQMVFMDTALTIVTGTAAERWKYAAFVVSSFVMGAFTYPLYRQLGLGRRLAGDPRRELRTGPRLRGLRGIGRGARGRRNHRSGHGNHDRTSHRQVHARRQAAGDAGSRSSGRAPGLLHPGLRLVRIQSRFHAGRFRQRQPAHRQHRSQHHARGHGRQLRRHAVHVAALRQAGRLHDRQRTAGRTGGDHRSQRLREPRRRCHHRPDRRRAGVPLGRVRREES